VLRIATRGSALARWQAEEVARLLLEAHPGVELELVVVATIGDLRLDVPVWELGGQGVFVKEVEAAVLDGRADVAVHSAKDLPSTSPPGLVIGAVPERGDPRDALVGGTLHDLAPGALIATGSVRRRAQLAWIRPDLTFTGLRGNIASRLGKRPPGGALVVAAAALRRLGHLDANVEVLSPTLLVPQVGQGAIAIERRADDPRVAQLLGAIDDPLSHRRLMCERGFLAHLGSGCDLPVGAFATIDHDGRMEVEGLLASLDGRVVLRDRLVGDNTAETSDDDAALGALVAQRLLAAGGAALLAASTVPGPGPGAGVWRTPTRAQGLTRAQGPTPGLRAGSGGRPRPAAASGQ
jgi:hydroxymethylbilane synthase